LKHRPLPPRSPQRGDLRPWRSAELHRHRPPAHRRRRPGELRPGQSRHGHRSAGRAAQRV